MKKPVIKEVIVVEGSHDKAHLKQFFDCETIVTGGLGIDEKVIAAIREAQKRSGVIVFTDPDEPGRKIRERIAAEVPGCRHAYVMKKDARTTRKVGVEHASYEALKEALDHTVVYEEPKEESISAAEFVELGLLGAENSDERRRKVCRLMHIGEGSAKALRQRLNRLGITAEDIRGILKNG